ncbi:MAG: FkbM family methyltransferase [Rhodobacteraceae bacterium]|nr:FkbM family methyltransferase [Paracoccaceae bacterium]
MKRKSLFLHLNLHRQPTRAEEGFLWIYDYGMPSNFEAGTRQLIAQLLPTVSLFVNVGANLGYYCCISQLAGIKTIALEPEPDNFQYLCKNMAINGFSRDIELLPLAAGAPPPQICSIYGASGGATLDADFYSGKLDFHLQQFVAVTRLDDVVIHHKWLQKQVLLLIDVEGSEKQVLAGAEQLLSLNPKPLWIIEILPDAIARQPDSKTIFQTMFATGYRAYEIQRTGALVEVTDATIEESVNGRTQPHEWNYLFSDCRAKPHNPT